MKNPHTDDGNQPCCNCHHADPVVWTDGVPLCYECYMYRLELAVEADNERHLARMLEGETV